MIRLKQVIAKFTWPFAGGLLLPIFILTPLAQAKSSSKHLVSIHYDGRTRNVPTAVKTVGEIVASAGITVGPNDLVEPSLNTAILEDSFNINIYRARPVLIESEGKSFVKMTAYQSPRKIADVSSVKVAPEDEVALVQTTDFVKDGTVGERLVVRKSKLIHLNLYGANVDLRTRKDTVRELFAEKHIVPAKDDNVGVPLDTRLTDGMTFFIARMGNSVTTAEEVIPFPVQKIQDANTYVGQQKVETPGSNGKKVVTYQLTLANGKEVSRTVIQEVMITPAVAQVLIVGTKPIELRSGVAEDKQRLMTAAGIASNEWAAADYIVSHESGWCPTKWQGQRGCPATYIPAGAGQGPGYGLVQATPGGKMASAGADWQTNPITQLIWATGYAKGRYGSWTGAYNHWLRVHSW